MGNKFQKFLTKRTQYYNKKWLKEGLIYHSDFRYVKKIIKSFAEIRAFKVIRKGNKI